MRTYTLTVWRGTLCTMFNVESPDRIRQLVIELFREEFVREPEHHWHKDGFMAEAWINTNADDEGFGNRALCIQLEQTNRWCEFQSGGRFLPVRRRQSILDWVEKQLEAA
jgi:hypothetical protein